MKQLFLLLIVMGLWAQDSCSAEIRLGKSSTVAFASVPEGKKILEQEDAFARALSPFDRSARVKADKQVSLEEIVADNFVLLVSGGKPVRSPEVLEAIARVLKEPAVTKKPAVTKEPATTQKSPATKNSPATKEPVVPVESKP
jgi:hypothetical protein